MEAMAWGRVNRKLFTSYPITKMIQQKSSFLHHTLPTYQSVKISGDNFLI